MRKLRHPVSFPAAALLALTLLVGFATAVQGRPTIRRAFFNAYPGAVGSRLDNLPSHSTHCGVCHYNFNGGGTRNPYGNAVKQALGTTPSTEQDILSVGGTDWDGDGYTSEIEIGDVVNFNNTPTFPGLEPSNVGNTSNVPNLAEITPYLVPTSAVDPEPPQVTLAAPNGGESWTGGISYAVTWSATDNVGVVAVDIDYRDSDAAPWTPVARNLANTGSFTWFVHNTPTTTARVRVVARDAKGNSGGDTSSSVFTIVRTPGGIAPTTLRDFHQPGTQPLGVGRISEPAECLGCHGGYDSAVEPGHALLGTMMAQAARDPLFYACLAVAEQDAPSSGDLCVRCHSPIGWLGGRSQPTSGAGLTASDRQGLSCDFCHRAVDPIYVPGTSPPEDQAILDGLLPAHRPTTHSNGQYVVDPDGGRKRGPFTDPIAPHGFLASAFHRSSDFCGTCHDVSNPVFERVSGARYVPGTFDQAAAEIGSHALMPLERTYSEWKNSDFPAGVHAPDFAGNKPDGIVRSCQDCHMPDVLGRGCNDPAAPIRPDLPFHDLTGGNAWMPPLIGALHPGETDAQALADAAARAASVLARAAVLDVTVEPAAPGYAAHVTVTNRAGHKLPTGYPEGRRMWLHVVAKDQLDQKVYESGAYDAGTGVLAHDEDIVVYEAHLGVSQALAVTLGLPPGPSFHFTLNDSVYKDNRIPPRGFTNAAFAAFGGAPVDDSRPAPRYPDGQHWDVSAYPLPATARKVVATLYYQTTSKEYVEFLRDANKTNSAGDDLHALWAANGRSAPVAMTSDSATIVPVGVPLASGAEVRLAPLSNPFRGALELGIELPRSEEVAIELYDTLGRRVAARGYGRLGPGTHELGWDGRRADGSDAGAGIFWVRVAVGGESHVRQVVRLR